jgi:DNA-binding NtrC family response regulator
MNSDDEFFEKLLAKGRALQERHERYFGRDPVNELVGQHPQIVAARETIRAIVAMPSGTRPLPLLVSGEAGTEKLFVPCLFRYFIGPRRDRGMADSDWLSTSEVDLERNLFGPQHGGGIVLFRRVERASLHLQERLLIAATDPAAAWLICTTEVDLAREVQAGRFDAALREALCAQWIDFPPLRARGHDVIRLAEYILARWCVDHEREPGDIRLLSDAVGALLAHPWPGNVEELQDVVRHAAAVAREGRIGAADLSLRPTGG